MMKNNFISLIKRFFPLVTVFMVILCCIVFPAAAEDVSYRKYEVSSKEVDGYDIVTLEFNPDSVYFYAYRRDIVGPGNSGSWSGYGAVTVPMFQNTSYDKYSSFYNAYSFRIYPAYVDWLYTSNIPAGTEISICCDLGISGIDTSSSPEDFFTDMRPYLQSSIQYRDKNNKIVKQEYGYDFCYWVGYHDAPIDEMTILDNDDIYIFSIRSQLDDFPVYNDVFIDGVDVTFYCKSYTVTLKIPTDYREREEEELRHDELMNGTPEQNESANNAAGILGDKGDKLGDLAGAIQADKPDLDSVNTNVSDLVPSTGVNTLTSAISPIANNDLVIKVLVMVATLILVSYVLFGKKG